MLSLSATNQYKSGLWGCGGCAAKDDISWAHVSFASDVQEHFHET
jgi:hypothetical protein